MNYDLIYDQLIFKAKLRELYFPLSGYVEKHHIIPKCIDPKISNLNKYPQNKAILTAREHYVAHQLLIKMNRYKNHKFQFKLVLSVQLMAQESKITKIGIRNNRLYEWIRILAANNQSKRMKGKKCGPHSAARCLNISAAKKGKTSPFKGKTMEEIVGVERATELSRENSKRNSGENHPKFGKQDKDSTKKLKSDQKLGRKHPHYDHTIHRWIHISGVEELLTQNDQKIKHNLGVGPSRLVNNYLKNYKGWQVKKISIKELFIENKTRIF